MGIKTFLVEDEPLSMDRLKELLTRFPDVEIVGEAKDGNSAIEKIDALKPELILLDIQMPGQSGFEVLNQMNHSPHVVFVTAYDQYALKAFEENAVDYILKPVSQDRLRKTIDRVLALNRKLDKDLIQSLQEAVLRKEFIRRFTVGQGDEILIFADNDVFYFTSEDKYTFLSTFNKRFIYDMTLKELETSLDPAVFCRIHKAFIINMTKIIKIKKWFQKDLIVYLSDTDHSRLKVSRRFKSRFLEKLKYVQ